MMIEPHASGTIIEVCGHHYRRGIGSGAVWEVLDSPFRGIRLTWNQIVPTGIAVRVL